MRSILYSVLLGCISCGVTAQAQLVRQANTTLALPPDLPSATGYSTENALGTLTFSSPMCTAFPSTDTDRIFVAERAGTIQVVTSLNGTPAKTLYLNLTALLSAGQSIPTDGENGLLSFAFHPNFATNNTLFVYFTIKVGSEYYQRLHQVTMSASASNATLLSHKPLLSIIDRATNHNGGSLHFGPDGFLYLSLGDEGNGGDSFNNARFINTQNDSSVHRTGFWGKLLRIAVETDAKNSPGTFPSGTIAPNAQTQSATAFPSALHGNYRVPADNPFIGYTRWHSIAIDPNSVRTEIFATGLRNPFRWTFDPPTGRIFIGDVGQDTYEEVDIVNKGDDLGWSWREGLHAYSSPPAPTTPPAPPNPGDPPGTGFSRVDPIFEYDHTNDGVGSDAIVWGPNITGGMVYRGNRLAELYGAYLFADYGNGYIVALRQQSGGAWTGTRLATNAGLVDFGPDPRNGDTIFCNLNDGTVRRLVRSGTNGANPPATLSATGVFSNLTTLTPNAGIVDYEPNVAFWSDYAIKSRWFSIKNLTDTIGFSADGNWTLPAGMVWIKHFDINTTRGDSSTRRKLETRILVKTASDVYGLSYKWRADQSDADLVAEDGLSETIPASSPAQTWRYPSRTECRVCHTSVAGFALSFKTRQMNHAHPYGAITLNQISALSAAGYFSATPANVNTLPFFAAATDATASREFRVRSYLAVNCVQCHQPGGAAIGNWDARATTATDSANLINGALVNNGGDAATRWAVPGDVAHSMVLKRLQGAGVSRMPPLATNELDPDAIQLLTDWITLDLPARQNFSQWQIAHFGSTTLPSAAATADPDADGKNNALEYLLGTDPNAAEMAPVLAPQAIGGNVSLTISQPANRAIVIETSADLQTWSPWNVPGNQPQFFSTPQMRTLIGPTLPQLFFRARISEQ